MVWKLDLEVIADSTPKLQQEPASKGVALLCSGDVIFGNKECSDADEISLILP